MFGNKKTQSTSALKRFRKYNKDGTLQSVSPNRVTERYGHTFGPKTGRKRSSVTLGPLKSVERVSVKDPKIKNSTKPKKPLSKRHGIFKLFRKRKPQN